MVSGPSLQEIKRMIYYDRNNTIGGHLQTIFNVDYTKYSGNIKADTFTIWKQDKFVGIFYGVIYGKLIQECDQTVVHYTVKQNIIGGIASLIVINSFFWSFLLRDIENGISIGKIIVALIFASLPSMAILLAYRFHKKKIVKDFAPIAKRQFAS